jgi:hypothetical protein
VRSYTALETKLPSRLRRTQISVLMSDAPPPPPPAGPPQLPPDLPHDSLKTNIIVSSAICWAIAVFFVALRFYTRGVIIPVLGASDWSVLLALVRGDNANPREKAQC